MRVLLMFAGVVFWLSLAAWIGALMTAGIAAACMFGTLPKLGVQLADFAAYDPQVHGRLAAGMVMERVFAVVDVVQFIAAPLALVAMIVLLVCGASRRGIRGRWSAGLAALCLVAAAATLGYQAFVLGPSMNRELHDYWSAARAGETAQAQERRAAFEQLHPLAENLTQARLLLLLGALAAAAITFAPSPARTEPRADSFV